MRPLREDATAVDRFLPVEPGRESGGGPAGDISATLWAWRAGSPPRGPGLRDDTRDRGRHAMQSDAGRTRPFVRHVLSTPSPDDDDSVLGLTPSSCLKPFRSRFCLCFWWLISAVPESAVRLRYSARRRDPAVAVPRSPRCPAERQRGFSGARLDRGATRRVARAIPVAGADGCHSGGRGVDRGRPCRAVSSDRAARPTGPEDRDRRLWARAHHSGHRSARVALEQLELLDARAPGRRTPTWSSCRSCRRSSASSTPTNRIAPTPPPMSLLQISRAIALGAAFRALHDLQLRRSTCGSRGVESRRVGVRRPRAWPTLSPDNSGR